MIELFVFTTFAIWFWLQFRYAKRLVWRSRWKAIAPVLIVLKQDAMAIHRNLRTWRDKRKDQDFWDIVDG